MDEMIFNETKKLEKEIKTAVARQASENVTTTIYPKLKQDLEDKFKGRLKLNYCITSRPRTT